MSRTFRRKQHHDAHDLRELEWVPARDGLSLFLQWVPLERGTAAHARRRAEFHADAHAGVWNAPHWYRQVHNRSHRARCNVRLRVLSAHDLDVVLPERPFQANWAWF